MGSVKTQVIATSGPARVDAVTVLLTVALPLPAGVVWGAPSLTAVILCIPPTPRGGTVVLTADQHSLAVVVMVAVPDIQSTGKIWPAAVLPAPAGPGESVQHPNLHHHLHDYSQSPSQVIILHLHLLLATITAIRERVLQKGEASQLT